MIMKKASIVCIGNELLNGYGIDTNSVYLCEKLLAVGIEITAIYKVGDVAENIVEAFRTAAEKSDVILITGGLGPTDDDITRQTLSTYSGRELVLNKEALADIEKFYSALSKQMPQRNIIQAYIPQGAKVIKNQAGTAPGIMLVDNGKLFFAMPGVPVEMKLMYEQTVEPELIKLKNRKAIAIRKLKCYGMGESNIAELLGDRMRRGREPLVNITVRDGVITLHIIATADDKTQADSAAKTEQREIAEILGDIVFADEESSLAEAVGRELTEKNKTVAVAESCTGGLISKLLTDVPGASNYFLCAWVAYSNDVKIRELGIEPGLIEKKGAVSAEVAAAMAEGARRRAGADYALGITGIAGPVGSTADKSVGLVYISAAGEGETRTQKYQFSGDRESVRKRAANAALDLLRRVI